jgi:hypothetical protein
MAGHEERMGEMVSAYILVRKPEGRDHSGDISVDRTTILK